MLPKPYIVTLQRWLKTRDMPSQEKKRLTFERVKNPDNLTHVWIAQLGQVNTKCMVQLLMNLRDWNSQNLEIGFYWGNVQKAGEITDKALIVFS